MRKQFLILFLAMLSAVCNVGYAQITGKVVDSKTKEPIPFVNVYYQGKSSIVTSTDVDGRYSIDEYSGLNLVFSFVGYKTKMEKISSSTKRLDVRLEWDNNMLKDVLIKEKRTTKYSRKNNPAVEMMRKVIAAKSINDLTQNPYFSYNKYEKMTFSVNEFTEKVFEDDSFKRFPFLKNHVETSPETGKLILPLTVEETVSERYYRKSPKADKTVITGHNNQGVNELFNTGDIMTTLLKDCFTEVDIYQDDVRMLQYPFISPIAEKGISFYRYYIVDTVMVADDKCFHLAFIPNNQQDFGFSGDLYIMADSSYQVRKTMLSIPRKSDVNFVEDLRVNQEFKQLPNGQRVIVSDDMLVQLKLANFLQKFQVQRITRYAHYDFDEIPERIFKQKKDVVKEASAQMRDEEFWEEYRPVKLSESESSMDLFLRNIEQIKGFKYIIFIAKAFIENFVELGASGKSKVDLGPINTMISQNFIDGVRLRASAHTTAHFHKNIFLKGYAAYGFRDQRWKGSGEVLYSFNEKDYLPREFPVNNLSLTYYNDVVSPVDKFLPTDKDNVFVSFKFTEVDQMMYVQQWKLKYECEWENGLRFTAQAKHEIDEPCGKLFYQPLGESALPSTNSTDYQRHLKSTDLYLGVQYQPGATYINTKQRRLTTNHDAPILGLNHTFAPKGVLGNNFSYNFTEASIYKRFWISSWGKIDTQLKAGVQWNRVPYPLLIMPAANLSYIMEDHTFNLINNMEFLNDRYSSLMVSWDMNGKILNRIPLLKYLKWREAVGVNVLWGALSDKNNPFLPQNAGDSRLYYFPGHFDGAGNYTYSSHVMDPNKPYVEAVVGIHNIFKLLHVEYVRRLTYTNSPEFVNTQKWGVRFMFRVTF